MRFLTLLLFAFVLACHVHAAEKSAAASDPAQALVSELYGSEKSGTSPFGTKSTRARVEHFFSKNLAALIEKDGEESRKRNEPGVLDFDPLFGAQDLEIKSLVVNKPVTAKGRTTVLVTFTNYTKKGSAKLDLVQEEGTWKISDIHYSNGPSLLKLFKDAGAAK